MGLLFNSTEGIAIQENDLSIKREQITIPWERITYPRELEIGYNNLRTAFFENLHNVSSRLS